MDDIGVKTAVGRGTGTHVHVHQRQPVRRSRSTLKEDQILVSGGIAPERVTVNRIRVDVRSQIRGVAVDRRGWRRGRVVEVQGVSRKISHEHQGVISVPALNPTVGGNHLCTCVRGSNSQAVRRCAPRGISVASTRAK